MSEITEEFNNGNAAQWNRTTDKIFLGNTETRTGEYTNSTYETIELAAGTLMGRVTATGELTPLISDASDGSQIPVGILLNDQVIEEGETATITIVVAGRVAEEMVVFADEDDDMDTIISGRRIRDRIGSDTVGIYLIAPALDHTDFDNTLQ
jgi:hypothetical protein